MVRLGMGLSVRFLLWLRSVWAKMGQKLNWTGAGFSKKTAWCGAVWAQKSIKKMG
jgi:hypothetical protein